MIRKVLALALAVAALALPYPASAQVATAKVTTYGGLQTASAWKVLGIAVPTGAYTAAYDSAVFDVSGCSTVYVFTNLTAVSGTSPSLQVYLDVSPDGGTTWFTGIQTVGSAITTVSNAFSNTSNFTPQVKIAWRLSGTSPSFTGTSWLLCR